MERMEPQCLIAVYISITRLDQVVLVRTCPAVNVNMREFVLALDANVRLHSAIHIIPPHRM